jgi:hypothetical protein
MAYSKIYYASLDFKKFVNFACFNATIYIEFEIFTYELVYLMN